MIGRAGCISRFSTNGNSEHTAIGPKQIEQSCEDPLALCLLRLLSSRRRLCDCTLQEVSLAIRGRQKYILETARTSLPPLIQLDSDFYTSEDVFLASFEIDTQLYNISIVDRKRP